MLGLGRCPTEKLLQKLGARCRGTPVKDQASHSVFAGMGQNAASPTSSQQIFSSNAPFNLELFLANQTKLDHLGSPAKSPSLLMRAASKHQPELSLLSKLFPSAAAGLDPARGVLTKN